MSKGKMRFGKYRFSVKDAVVINNGESNGIVDIELQNIPAFKELSRETVDEIRLATGKFTPMVIGEIERMSLLNLLEGRIIHF